MEDQTPASDNSAPKGERPTAAVPKWLVPGIFLTLLAWGLYLAIGASFPKQGNVLDDPQSLVSEDEPTTPTDGQPLGDNPSNVDEAVPMRPQPQRGLVVAVCFVIFIAWFWGLQRLYQKRHPPKS